MFIKNLKFYSTDNINILSSFIWPQSPISNIFLYKPFLYINENFKKYYMDYNYRVSNLNLLIIYSVILFFYIAFLLIFERKSTNFFFNLSKIIHKILGVGLLVVFIFYIYLNKSIYNSYYIFKNNKIAIPELYMVSKIVLWGFVANFMFYILLFIFVNKSLNLFISIIFIVYFLMAFYLTYIFNFNYLDINLNSIEYIQINYINRLYKNFNKIIINNRYLVFSDAKELLRYIHINNMYANNII